MKLHEIEIRNYRCFEDFVFDFAGASATVIAPNAGGKTSLLSAIRLALRGGNRIRRADFRDETEPIEIVASLKEIPAAAHGAFASALTFTQPPTLRIGVRATWDPAEEEVELVFGFPDAAWGRAGREARENLPLVWLPAWRDPERLVPLGRAGSLMDDIVGGLGIGPQLDTAAQAIGRAGEELARADALAALLRELGTEISSLIPDLGQDPYALAVDYADPRALLREFELMLEHDGRQAPATTHSGGLVQLTIFSLALRLIDANPGTLVLVDEPEHALHPQAQRALVKALRDRAGQVVVATHSAAVLDRADPREITRLRRGGAGVEAVTCAVISDPDARRLSRYATAQTAEAYFARAVVLFEGPSDLLAFRVLARTAGVDLDGRGAALLSLEGANVFATYLELLGPHGLDLDLLGLVDADAAARWIAALNTAGVGVVDRPGLEALGFHVCDPDLEAELLAPLSSDEVLAVFDAEGTRQQFDTFSNQPAWRERDLAERQLAFVKNDKVRYAPLLAAQTAAAAIPGSIRGLLDHV